jgi:hypothetical protein
MSFPPANEMFQFAGFASYTYEFSVGYRLSGGFPHSEIPGSKLAPSSPGLIAECHVLHRLSVPRHPPNALLTLETTSMRRDKPKAHGRLISATNTASSVFPTPKGLKTNKAKRPIHAVKEPDVRRYIPDTVIAVARNNVSHPASAEGRYDVGVFNKISVAPQR